MLLIIIYKLIQGAAFTNRWLFIPALYSKEGNSIKYIFSLSVSIPVSAASVTRIVHGLEYLGIRGSWL